jgi:hypothetical protein
MDWITVFIILTILFLSGMVYMDNRNAKNRVRKFLEEQGFNQIEIRTQWFTGRRRSVSFDVEYCDMHGMIQKNIAVIKTGDKIIYWAEPLIG